jgi:hypothetical protein
VGPQKDELIYEWEHLEIKEQPNKSTKGKINFGLFAKEDIPAGNYFRYWGEYITKDERKRREEEGRSCYILTLGNYQTRIDANPSLPFPDLMNIAAYLNEPNKNEKKNCELIGRDVKIIKTIKKGEELLVSYGDEYKRDY